MIMGIFLLGPLKNIKLVVELLSVRLFDLNNLYGKLFQGFHVA
jgi:hypothetical protein